MIRKICVVTGGRADYGLLRLLMRKIQKSRQFQLQVIATGSHFLPKFGSTYREILKDGFKIDAKVNLRLAGDSAVALGQAMGLGIKGLSRALEKMRPDLIVLLGDRYEILAAATAATLAAVPIAHLHGGELTVGAYDDAFRHAITKMSHLHFVATSAYRKRVIQMGEQPARVFQVGALGVDNVFSTKFYNRREIEKKLKFHFQKQNLLVTFHPATLEPGKAGGQAKALLKALKSFSGAGIIFTMPGADKEGKIVWEKILKFVRFYPKFKAFTALGSRLYLSLMREVDAVVGNSSSGLLEAPALNKPVVNIGNRQRGRIQANCVVNCPASTVPIKKAIRRVLRRRFRQTCRNIQNPLGKGGTAQKILKILKRRRHDKLKFKKFNDIPK